MARIRVLAGHTQSSLAQAAGVSKSTVQRLEAGGLPSGKVALRISRALGHGANVLVVFPDLSWPL